MNIRSILAIGVSTFGLIFLPLNAQAALITGVSASSNMGNFLDPNMNNTVNGAGLPGNLPSLTGNHAAAAFLLNAWSSEAPNVTGNITFNLNGSYDLSGFSFWNFNGNNTFGIRGVTVQTSLDGLNFAAVTGGPTQFAQGTFFGSEPPELFSFSPVQASYVRFVVSSNWGQPSQTGFSEVQFDGTPFVAPTSTPEPGSILGLFLIGGSLLASKRSTRIAHSGRNTINR